MYKIGLLGYGKMGGAIIDGLVKSNKYKKEDICIFSLNKEDILRDGYFSAEDEKYVYENSNILIFAIKPQQFEEVMPKLKNSTNKPNLIITIAAGITVSYIERELGNDLAIVRVMPNLGASINMAVTTMCHNKNVNEKYLNVAKEIFESIGTVTLVEESQINPLLPLNGSYPAYIWYFIRSFVRYAEKSGINPKDARNMLADATIGCAKMLKDSSLDLDTLINNVCSYKGTTIEGVYVFDNNDLDKIVYDASFACAKRGDELAK